MTYDYCLQGGVKYVYQTSIILQAEHCDIEVQVGLSSSGNTKHMYTGC